jgi:hypothetical protein
VTEQPPRSWPPPLFLTEPWQMSFGERAAFEGVLAQCRPRLAIEIGTAEGGSLAAIARHSVEVHAIDLERPEAAVARNVELHIGDSKQVLPELLARLAAAGRNVDFALVDGDHSTGGVRTDLVNLLSSPATGRTLILLHDTMNEAARAGVESVEFADFPKVRYVELDFLAGYLCTEPFEGQLLGGFGVVIVDEAPGVRIPGSIEGDPRYYDAHTMVGRLGGSFERERTTPTGLERYTRDEGQRAASLSDQLDDARRALAEHRRALESVERSLSWRVTAPLRAMKRFARRMAERRGGGRRS